MLMMLLRKHRPGGGYPTSVRLHLLRHPGHTMHRKWYLSLSLFNPQVRGWMFLCSCGWGKVY